MRIKISPLKNVAEVKEVYNFLSDCFKISYRENAQPFNLLETYNAMIDNLKTNKNLGLKAQVMGILVGFAFSMEEINFDNSIFIRTIMVKKIFQKQGIARRLMKLLEKNIKKAGYDTIKIREREGANGFYIRSGYIPYLYVIVKNKGDIEKVKAANAKGLKILYEGQTEKGYLIKYDVEEEAVYMEKRMFWAAAPDVTSEFIYEKNLRK